MRHWISKAATGLAGLLLCAALQAPAGAQAEGMAENALIAQSGNATCVGTLPAGQYINVTVPANTTCTLDQNHRIFADLRVEPGATLWATSVYVEANLVSFGSIYATDIRVGGNAHLSPTSSGAPSFVVGSSIGANLELRGGAGGFRLEQTVVGGNVRLLDVDPSGTYGADLVANDRIGGQLESTNRFSIRVEGTTVGGSLVCHNFAPSWLGGGNIIGGQTSCP